MIRGRVTHHVELRHRRIEVGNGRLGLVPPTGMVVATIVVAIVVVAAVLVATIVVVVAVAVGSVLSGECGE